MVGILFYVTKKFLVHSPSAANICYLLCYELLASMKSWWGVEAFAEFFSVYISYCPLMVGIPVRYTLKFARPP